MKCRSSAVLGFLVRLRLLALIRALHMVGTLGGHDLCELFSRCHIRFADVLLDSRPCAHLGHVGTLDVVSLMFSLSLSLPLSLSLSASFSPSLSRGSN